MDFLGGLIGAGLNFFNASQNRKAQEEANRQNIALQRETNQLMLADKERDRALQYDFAQQGVQWRAADALAAGIHPIYALGSSGASYSPSAISLGTARVDPETMDLGSMGQDISRAISATKSQTDRDVAFNESVRKLSLTKMGLENELLSTQIAKQRGQIGPPMPVSQTSSTSRAYPEGFVGPIPPFASDKPGEIPDLRLGGPQIRADNTVANMEEFEKRYGDEGPHTWVLPPWIMWRDMMHHNAIPQRVDAMARRMEGSRDRYYREWQQWWRGNR